MAITATALQPTQSGFLVNATTADASGCEEIQAAPGAGLNLVLQRVWISSDATLTVTIGEGESTGAVENVLIGPLPMVAGFQAYFEFTPDLLMTANKSLTVDASGAGNLCIVAQGRTI